MTKSEMFLINVEARSKVVKGSFMDMWYFLSMEIET